MRYPKKSDYSLTRQYPTRVKMRVTYTLFFLLGLLFLSSSCAVEKRSYRKGYHVDWNTKPVHAAKPKKIISDTQKLLAQEIKIAELNNYPILEDDALALVQEPISAFAITATQPTLVIGNSPQEIPKHVTAINFPKYVNKEIHSPEQLKNQPEYFTEKLYRPWSTTAILGFCFSVLAFALLVTVLFPFFTGLTGLILSIIGIKKTTGPNAMRGFGFALAGLVISTLVILLFWLVIFILLAFMGTLFGLG
ncbi:MAG: DUF4190 domain-containing protein [Luteibaculaceae bacterium]